VPRVIVKPKRYDFSEVEGISQKQLELNYEVYLEQVAAMNRIWNELETEFHELVTKEFGPIAGELRSLLLGQGFALDGVKMHELYFENITGGRETEPEGRLLKSILRDFGSVENWVRLLKAAAKSVNGWVVTAFEPVGNRLRIYGQDTNDMGPIWGTFPLIVLDVYEHAYFFDFGNDIDPYLDAFIENINWDVVAARLDAVLDILGLDPHPHSSRSGKGSVQAGPAGRPVALSTRPSREDRHPRREGNAPSRGIRTASGGGAGSTRHRSRPLFRS